MAASTAGGLWSRSDQLNNAQREANARNGVLSTAINGLNQDYSNINAPAFSGAVGGIPTAASLKGAQNARTAAIQGNIPAPGSGVQPPAPSDAPPAVAANRAAAMKNATDFVNNQATATGNLGGYGDSWFNSGLNEQDAARKIGIGNLFANETKSLISPEQDLAGAAAYKTPSFVPGVLQGAGGMLGSYAGRNVSPNGPQLPFGAGRLFAPTPSDMLSDCTSRVDRLTDRLISTSNGFRCSEVDAPLSG